MSGTTVLFFEEENVKFVPGVYPAHVVAINKGREFNNSIPFNPKFRIAPEAADFELETEEGEKVSGEKFIGYEVRHKGMWLSLDNKKPKSNNLYVIQAKAMGLEFEQKEVEINGKKRKATVLTELNEDILGNPVLVKVDYVEEKDGGKRAKVTAVYPAL
jgi:hypothetical protein